MWKASPRPSPAFVWSAVLTRHAVSCTNLIYSEGGSLCMQEGRQHQKYYSSCLQAWRCLQLLTFAEPGNISGLQIANLVECLSDSAGSDRSCSSVPCQRGHDRAWNPVVGAAPSAPEVVGQALAAGLGTTRNPLLPKSQGCVDWPGLRVPLRSRPSPAQGPHNTPHLMLSTAVLPPCCPSATHSDAHFPTCPCPPDPFLNPLFLQSWQRGRHAWEVVCTNLRLPPILKLCFADGRGHLH